MNVKRTVQREDRVGRIRRRAALLDGEPSRPTLDPDGALLDGTDPPVASDLHDLLKTSTSFDL